jgi:hypothetical protein
VVSFFALLLLRINHHTQEGAVKMQQHYVDENAPVRFVAFLFSLFF